MSKSFPQFQPVTYSSLPLRSGPKFSDTLQHFVIRLCAQGQVSRGRCRSRTQGAGRTETTVGSGKFDTDHLVSPGIRMRSPASIGVIPSQPEREPHHSPEQLVLANWNQASLDQSPRNQLVLARDEQIGIHIARIHAHVRSAGAFSMLMPDELGLKVHYPSLLPASFPRA
jgi:hypothetical protein